MKKSLVRFLAVFATAVLLIAPVGALADSSYTYVYDFWGEYQECPDIYEPSSVLTSADLGLELPMKSPSGMFVKDQLLYVCDTGNNRIIELNRVSQERLEVSRIIDSFIGDIENVTFNGPTDINIAQNGDIYIADKGNARILKLDKDLNYIMEFSKPDDPTIDKDLVYAPNKIVVDSAGRVYCVASGINKGLVKYEADGTFSGFVGATPVQYDFWDYIRKRFASQEQREQMVNFVPTEYDNIYLDHEGFIYTCQGGQEETDLINASADDSQYSSRAESGIDYS